MPGGCYFLSFNLLKLILLAECTSVLYREHCGVPGTHFFFATPEMVFMIFFLKPVEFVCQSQFKKKDACAN